MKDELLRKLFHLSGLLYVAGILFLEKKLLMGFLGAWLIIEFSFEVLRLKWAPLKSLVSRVGGRMFREEENRSFTGTFWMALGVFVTALISASPNIAAAAVLYLILGDGVASLAGKGLGGPKWFGSEKRVSGSSACFAACLAVGFIFLYPAGGLLPVLVGAVTATAVEGAAKGMNDNFLIPVFSVIALKLSIGLPLIAF